DHLRRRDDGRPVRRDQPGDDRGHRLHGHRRRLGQRARCEPRRGAHRRQHGAPAPLDARRAAPGDGARGRDHHLRPHGHRLPAHRHREEHRVPQLGAGRHLRDADGLPVTDLQRDRLQPGRREAARHRGAPPGPGHPRALHGAHPDQQPPGGFRHRRPRARRADGHDERLPRAGDGPRRPGDDHRAPDEPRLRAPGRPRPGPAAGCGREGPRPARGAAGSPQGHRRPADRQPDLAGPHAGHRAPRRAGLPGARRHRTGAALGRSGLGPAQDRALLRLRGLRVRRGDLDRCRLLGALPRPQAGALRVAEDHRTGARQARAGTGDGRGHQDRLAGAAGARLRRHGAVARPRQEDHGHLHGGAHPPLQAGDRGLPRPAGPGLHRRRVAPRRARLPRRQRRRHPALPRARARPVLHEPPGHGGDVRGRHALRRDRRGGLDRPGDGRGRPM
ncbi:MAG: NADH-ubiquinone oxidoreductase chain D, partial [uncultured Frankineae bacterium]